MIMEKLTRNSLKRWILKGNCDVDLYFGFIISNITEIQGHFVEIFGWNVVEGVVLIGSYLKQFRRTFLKLCDGFNIQNGFCNSKGLYV